MEKLLDSIIDERMGQGKTDEQILAELGMTTGIATELQSMTPEQR